MIKKIRSHLIQRALGSWRSLNEVISYMSELEVERALAQETTGDCRKTIMRRLHQRLVRLRTTRERNKLMRKKGGRDVV